MASNAGNNTNGASPFEFIDGAELVADGVIEFCSADGVQYIWLDVRRCGRSWRSVAFCGAVRTVAAPWVTTVGKRFDGWQFAVRKAFRVCPAPASAAQNALSSA